MDIETVAVTDIYAHRDGAIGNAIFVFSRHYFQLPVLKFSVVPRKKLRNIEKFFFVKKKKCVTNLFVSE